VPVDGNKTYPLSEWFFYVKYYSVNKAKKQTNYELKSLVVTDVTEIRVEL
jgi:hypothetical protein